MIEIKKQLYTLCTEYVQNRMEAAQQAINDAQKASNDDTKSSAGDKYETGREMAQQETNRNLAQLNEANKLKIALNLISYEHLSEQAEPGAVIITDQGNFYMAISAGLLTVKNENYFAISPASPIGLKLKGLKAGAQFNLNNKIYLIKQII
ncbi:3-oxoacyl-ACP synthase [Mucilaginibacter sp. X4EP1]|jgi:F0F1-type ATP synthase epsilon subunit|uniref:3-oxoacyl-ACP synthase n=1 Tax=Mucilaginibacter sp. X4EP1 TaxID=2723092 RepID=UPI00216A6FF9|nr:3-oxoacyl-ACP synthase [Mucilaginibacter sp. X4EP1]MCS3812450.1 F0F1-type ATP synthase epsilon subunit [Mucilaginibacter sp. X4EP1]